MDAEFKICEYCLANNELRDEIRLRGTIIEKCLICQSTGGRALPVSDQRVKQIFRALVRLNYSEWDYNTHIGGETLESFVFGKHAIFNLPENASELDFEDAFLVLEEGWYPQHPEDITLGGGYWDGYVLNGLRDEMDSKTENILERGFKSNYFDLESDVVKLIDSVRNDITKELTVGAKFSRARIGVKDRLIDTPRYSSAPSSRKIYHYLPFSQVDIDRPPIQIAAEGRFNRARVSILYLASDKDTAVAELRPHPGHLVSTAEFELIRSIRIADFSTHDIRNFLSDDRLEVFRRILSISTVLNLPIQPEHRELYLLTQLFSDCIRHAGFDGISYRSSLGPGTNLACFTADAFRQIPESESVMEVRSLHYDLAPRNALAQNYDRTKYENDENSPLATLFDGLTRKA